MVELSFLQNSVIIILITGYGIIGLPMQRSLYTSNDVRLYIYIITTLTNTNILGITGIHNTIIHINCVCCTLLLTF